MDLLPNVKLEPFFNNKKRRNILRKLEVHKCDSLATLLYMFTRAPPLIYDFFYTSVELNPDELRTLKFLVEQLEREALRLKLVIQKNARILTKLTESIEERKQFTSQRAPFTKFNIGYRVETKKRIEGMRKSGEDLVQSLATISHETGIPAYTLDHWYRMESYYSKMAAKYPGILSLGRFGEPERHVAEAGQYILEEGVEKAREEMPGLNPNKMTSRLIFYIKCAQLAFPPDVELHLDALRQKLHSGDIRMVQPKLMEFNRVHMAWRRNNQLGGVGNVGGDTGDIRDVGDIGDIGDTTHHTELPVEDNSNSNPNSNPSPNPNSNPNPVKVRNVVNALITSHQMSKKRRKWELKKNMMGKGGSSQRIPGIANISHRFVKEHNRGRIRNRLGKTKYDLIEERWACVILNKYLVLTPAEIACVLRMSSMGVWHSLELYEDYGPRGLVENVWKEKMAEEYTRKYGEAVKTYAQETLGRGETLSLIATVNHIKSHSQDKIISKMMIAEVFKNLGYTYCQTRIRYAEKHKTRVINMRVDYIKYFFRNRGTGREQGGQKMEVYVDESFIRDFKETRHFWMTDEIHKTRTVPISTIYNQIAIVGAMNTHGWIGVDYDNLTHNLKRSNNNYTFSYGGIQYFKTINPDRRDPHTCFTRDTFGEYFRDHLVPSLNESSLIIMDRAPYHTPLAESEFNIKKARRQELQEVLLTQGAVVNAKSTTEQLRALCVQYCPETKTYLEAEAELTGHKVLYTPPYHPELNPIEMAWSMIKRSVPIYIYIYIYI